MYRHNHRLQLTNSRRQLVRGNDEVISGHFGTRKQRLVQDSLLVEQLLQRPIDGPAGEVASDVPSPARPLKLRTLGKVKFNFCFVASSTSPN
jgi:hypothetical protein